MNFYEPINGVNLSLGPLYAQLPLLAGPRGALNWGCNGVRALYSKDSNLNVPFDVSVCIEYSTTGALSSSSVPTLFDFLIYESNG